MKKEEKEVKDKKKVKVKDKRVFSELLQGKDSLRILRWREFVSSLEGIVFLSSVSSNSIYSAFSSFSSC